MESTYLKQRREIKLGNCAPSSKKMPKRIPLKSAKMKVDDSSYKKLVKEMLAENPYCELKVPGVCTGRASGLHHTKRRGKLLLVRKYLKRACNACNGYCEKFPLIALEKGLSLSVHKKENEGNYIEFEEIEKQGTPAVVLIDPDLKTIVVEERENFNK